MNIEKDVFELFMKYGDDKYELNKRFIEYVNKVIRETKISKNNETLEIIISLHDSINNAGCEDRRSKQIDTLSRAMDKLDNEIYELTH